MKILSTFFVVGFAFIANAQSIDKLNGDALFGDIKARHLGPALMSGRVSDIEGHPTDSKTIFIGTAGGGVWKSQDGGVMFNSIFDKHCQSIGCVAIDPVNPDKTIWVGTGEVWTRNSTSIGDGIYKSNNGGKSWKKMGLEKSDRISSIQINPNNTDEVFVGVQGALWGPNEERGVYKTIDGGLTWEKIFYIDENTGCSELVMDPKNPNILYASFWEHRRTAWSFSSGGEQCGLYKSIDGGKSWNKIHQGFPKGTLGRIAIAIAPSNSSILYSVIESADKKLSGMYRSEDAGENWKHLNSDFGLVVRPFYFSRIVVHPKNPDIVVKAGLFGSFSRDGGKTFKGLGAMHPDIHDFWFDIKDGDKMFVATDGGLYRSMNSGATMEMVQTLPISQFYHVSVDNQKPYMIYGGLQDNGSWYGPSSSPGGVEGRDWETIGFGDGFRVYSHPEKPNITYSEMQGAEAIWRYDSDIKQSKVVKPLPVKGDPKLRFNWNAPITTSPNSADRLYVGSQFLHVSDDMGDNWRKISPDLTTDDKLKQEQEGSGGLSKDNSGAENHCTIFTIAESELDQNIIWIGTDDGNVQVTKDAGKTWSNVTENLKGLPANTWCYHIEASVFEKGTAYAVFDGHTSNDKNTYCYKTTDFGATWTSIITDDVYGFARSFQEDFENPNLLFLGTEFGLYVTLNGGKNWVKFENNMPATAIHYITMQKETNDLVMGTHGRGIIIMDDVSPLRQISEKMMAEKLFFMEMKPFEMSEQSDFGGTSSPTQFVGANPSTNARITYYLSKRHTFGKMSMKVLDKDGNFVSNLTPGKKKGINIVNWSFYGMGPRIAKGKSFARGGMTPPRVPAGEYTIVVKKGKESYQTKIQVEYTKNSIFSLAERKQQFEVSKMLFGLNEELAYMVYVMDEFIVHSEKTSKENSKMKKTGLKLTKELNDLKKVLVITSGDNYVGTVENQLREKMSNVYGAITGYYGAPTKTQMQNIALIEGEMNSARKNFSSIQSGSLSKYVNALKKNEITAPNLKTFEEYVKKD